MQCLVALAYGLGRLEKIGEGSVGIGHARPFSYKKSLARMAPNFHYGWKQKRR